MAKKIRFPLKMKNGASVRTIEELRENFDYESALGYYADGKLISWLRDRYYDAEAEKISALDQNAKSFPVDFCKILGVEFQEDCSEVDINYVTRRKEKIQLLHDLTEDEGILYNVDSVAFNQDDLLDILDEGKKEIYLCQGEFEIPLSVKDVTYIGLCNPIVTIRATDNVNFKEKNLKFIDLYYGWDTSNVTPNDMMWKAEQLFLRGEYQKSVDILETLVEQDNPRAIMLLSRIYRGYLINTEKGNFLLKEGEELHDVFFVIENASRRTEQYFPLLKKLADNGNAINEFYYGFGLYKDGFYNEGKYNVNEMMKYYHSSAEKGNSTAMSGLGHRYYDGNGIEQDYKKAIEWYRKAAEQGNINAYNSLGICYEYGNGVEQDKEKAVEWYRKAAEQGNMHAQCNLGYCYEHGMGVDADRNKAREWYEKAAAQGFERAKKALNRL